jgi:hypothetical protein
MLQESSHAFTEHPLPFDIIDYMDRRIFGRHGLERPTNNDAHMVIQGSPAIAVELVTFERREKKAQSPQQ